jgi:chemotaxis signal transduction protein
MDDRGRGLEFLVGSHGVVVPAALVERVIEVELSPPPPLARAWVGGLGVCEGAVFVAVDLVVRPRAASVPPGRASVEPAVCVMLDTGKRAGLRWALRVNRTIGFVDVTRCARPSSMPAEWQAWIAGAQFKDSTVVGLLDVASMARAFEA